MKKKVLAGLLAAALSASALSTAAFAEEPLKMGFIVGSFEHVFYNLIAEGIEEKAEELGIEATVLDAELDANIASDKIQNLSADGNVAIALACNDAAGVKPAIENADKEGVKMFTFDCTTDSDAINCFVGTDNYEGGRLGGQELIRLTEDGDTVAIIGYPTASSCLDRENGALEVLEEADRNVLTGYNYEGDANKAQEIMENILTSNPDVKAVFCVGDPAASGALASIKANASDCKIIGFDGNPEAKEAILGENGQWWVSEISQNPHEIGTRIVEEMNQFMTDGTVTDEVIYIAPYIITAETLAEEAETEAAE
ncbi:MAG: substrate-binding domain-containing protein [Eubacteriales bacterium]|nr:substrate-binding domain-containing protein [Eubacteriales bacterium]